MNRLTSTTARIALLAALSSLPMQGIRADVKANLDIDLSKHGPVIPPTFGGLMTEEINHSYDGGLFAELVQNRTFQDPAPRRPQGSPQDLPVHWSLIGDGKANIDRNDPVSSALPLSLRLDLTGSTAGVANDGYWGIPIRPGTKYTATFYARGGAGFAGPASRSEGNGHRSYGRPERGEHSRTADQYCAEAGDVYLCLGVVPPNLPTAFVYAAAAHGEAAIA